jgi:hypothetical protein
MRVPDWLNHLRTDRRGIPVPYVNLWGDEDVTRISIRYDQHVRAPGVFLDDTHEIVPDFTRQNIQRQRQCMAAGLCQVCARPVPWSRRTVVLAALSVEWIDFAGRQVPVVNEPWLCRRCADFAVTHCPALIRRRRDEQLQIIPVRREKDCQLVVSRGYVDGPLEVESRRVQPAMWAKLLLTAVRIERTPAVTP